MIAVSRITNFNVNLQSEILKEPDSASEELSNTVRYTRAHPINNIGEYLLDFNQVASPKRLGIRHIYILV